MKTTRRTFFRLLSATGMMGASASFGWSGSEPSARVHALQNGTVRQAFDFAEALVPMNAANLCPSPRAVAEAVTRYTRSIDLDSSFQNRAQFARLLELSRAAVAEPLGVSPDEIALVRNTSEANNIIIAGLDLARGDEVVIWEQNHPTNNVAWEVRARRHGFAVRRVSVPAAPQSVEELIDPFRRAINPRTRVLTVTHVSNVSGIRLPIAALGALCRQHGIFFHVDGAQSWGAFSLDLQAIGCDSFAASAHKWFMGPKEVGLLYVRDSAIERVWPSIVAPGWGDGADTILIGARKFESLGQRDDAALAAVANAAELHAEVGPEAVEAHMLALTQRLKEGLKAAGATLVTPLDPAFSGGVCVVHVDPAHRQTLFDRLYREHGIIAAPTGGLRLCPHLYNTEEHVDRAIAGVRAMADLLA